jgi:hypothetical protein
MSHGVGFVPRRFVLGQFAEPEAMLAATKKMREKGHKKLDTHTPYPVAGIEEALGLGRAKIPTIVLCGALTGTCLAYAMIYFCNVIDFPINVANRPIHSPAANVPIMFELTILLGSISAFMGLMGLMRLPEPYHPVFEAESFRRASIDSFFVSVELSETDDSADVAAQLRTLGSQDVQVVEESER